METRSKDVDCLKDGKLVKFGDDAVARKTKDGCLRMCLIT